MTVLLCGLEVPRSFPSALGEGSLRVVSAASCAIFTSRKTHNKRLPGVVSSTSLPQLLLRALFKEPKALSGLSLCRMPTIGHWLGWVVCVRSCQVRERERDGERERERVCVLGRGQTQSFPKVTQQISMRQVMPSAPGCPISQNTNRRPRMQHCNPPPPPAGLPVLP